MLRASFLFFVLGIISILLGVNSIAGLSIDIGKLLLIVFLTFSVISFFGSHLRGKKSRLLVLAVIISTTAALTAFNNASAGDSLTETAKELGNDTRRATKDAVRKVKDKTCHIRKGKMECALQKTKHTLQKGSDQIEDAID